MATNEDPTLVLTDVVDSTRLNDMHGDAAMAAAWALHDRAARAAMGEWRGREIARSDGFLVTFAKAADAVGFALAYQRLLTGLPVPMRARVGLHSGPIVVRENSAADVARGAPAVELDGIALPVAARVMSVAGPGQSLLSAAAMQQVGAQDLHAHSHGYWRVKGVEEPIELFEVAPDGVAFVPPADSDKAYCVVRNGDLWLPRRRIPHTLPAEPDGFVGRDADLWELARRFEDGARLVSLLGIGGIGKTRLARRFGWTWLGAFGGGVWFCDLLQARSLDGVVHAVAKAMDVPLGGAAVEQLGRAIAGRGHCLVIVDNFEQVARHAAETIGVWRDAAPKACFIVTTREVLGLAGEQVVNLAPLGVQDAARLFIDRAHAAGSTAVPGAPDRECIERLVQLLDGLPLAIELAAVRARVMSPGTLLARMSERFKLLAAGGMRRDRQSTLRSTFDWSWDLLSEAERSALAQLSVFEGGFDLAAAEALLDGLGNVASWPVDLVQALVEKSMVRRGAADRLGLLKSVQDYAAEHLATPGRFEGSGPAALAAAQARHWRHFAAIDERRAAQGTDIDNLVAACRRAAAQGDATAAAATLLRVWASLCMTGPFRVALELAASFEALPAPGAEDAAAVDWVAGSAAYLLGDVDEASRRLAAGMDRMRSNSKSGLAVRLACALAELQMSDGRYPQAEACLLDALERARRLHVPALEYLSLNGLGSLEVERGRSGAARAHFEAALALAERVGDRRWEGGLHSNLGVLDHGNGRLPQAQAHYERALALAGEVGDRRWAGSARCNLALLHLDQGRAEQAHAQFLSALAQARELGNARLESFVLCNLGIATEALGELSTARGHHEQAVVAAAALGDHRAEGQFRGYLGLILARLGCADAANDHLERGEALLVAAGDQPSLGVLLCQRALAEVALGSPQAPFHLVRAERIAQACAAAASSDLGRAIERARTAVNCLG